MKNGNSLTAHRNFLLASALIFAFVPRISSSAPVAVSPGQSGNADTAVAKDYEKAAGFTLGVGAGYLTGESKELVYWPDFGNHKASELTWKIDNLFMIGLSASLRTGRWFTVNFDGWVKATDGDGSMDDYDWTLPGVAWTNRSEHEDTDVTDGSMIDINGQVSFYRTAKVIFNGYLGYKRDNFGWESRGGDFVYSVDGFRDTTGSFADDSLAASYEQTFDVPYMGFGIETDFGRFKLDGRIIFSPFVKAEAVDHHHMRNLVIYEDFSNGDMIAVDIAGKYEVTKHLAIECGFSFQSYDTMQGDTEWHFNDTGEVVSEKNGGGIAQDSSMLSFSLLYSF